KAKVDGENQESKYLKRCSKHQLCLDEIYICLEKPYFERLIFIDVEGTGFPDGQGPSQVI
ncbi:MAG: hypothetical protein MHPSP_003938, partial [Paramarteilia canceri]